MARLNNNRLLASPIIAGIMVQMGNSLQDVAKLENWVDLGDALASAISDPGAYGLGSQQEVIQNVAEIRGKKPHTLKNPLNAAKWLKERFSEIHRDRPAWLGMTLVMYLMKIEELDADRFSELAPLVFEGKLKQLELKAIFDELRMEKVSAKGSRGGAQPSTRLRAQMFDEAVNGFLRTFGHETFDVQSIKVLPGKILDPISADFLVELPDGKRVAVEVKSYRSRADRHQSVNVLGHLLLLRKLVPEVVLVVPENSAYNLSEIAAIRDKLSLEGIHLATLPEAGGQCANDLRAVGKFGKPATFQSERG